MKKVVIVQGDVLLRRVDAVPAGAKEQTGEIVLALGEVTGHAHVVESIPGVTSYIAADGRMFIEVPEGHTATVRHQEHGPVTLPPGVWERGIVREYDPFAEAARQVAD